MNMIGQLCRVLLALLAAGFVTNCSALTYRGEEFFVRVAISDNQFKDFSYGEIELTATDDYDIYAGNSATPLLRIPKDRSTKITLNGGNFSIFVEQSTQARTIAEAPKIRCASGFLGVKNLKRAGKQALYRGEFEIVKAGNGKFFLVNTVELEDYVRAVVPNEMEAKYSMEALKAQAIAARSYAMAPRGGPMEKFDLYDSTLSQSYFGVNTEAQSTTEAVKKTAGLVAIGNGSIITAQYTTASCGHTENCENVFSSSANSFPGAANPCLRGRPDYPIVGNLRSEAAAKKFYKSRPKSYEAESKFFRWQVEWSAEELEEILQKTLQEQMGTGFVKNVSPKPGKFGKLRHINVKKRGVSGMVIEMEIVTDSQKFTVKKELVIRRVLKKNGAALLSANIAFDHMADKSGNLQKIVAYGGGFGHDVGMSQHGAEFMATRLHKTFDQILKSYYSGISIAAVPVIFQANGQQATETRNFYSPKKAGTLVIGGEVSSVNIKINGEVVRLKPGSAKAKGPLRIDISKYMLIGKNSMEVRRTKNARGQKSTKICIEIF
ncbi:MAG: SpoIID/LytB domain-containing protein [Puniceicoccales bacterium]|jgi:SpoIID/LytB domain protein|nr:SpoIID/LytB domain-containing protein [Puniceicoccales bacterium]